LKAQKVQFLLGGIPAGSARAINHLPNGEENGLETTNDSEVA
jgi:hypothetical protein